MPLKKRNSVTAKAMGLQLIFSLFDVTSAREVPFGIPQYVQCILQGLISVLLCIPFIFADNESVNLVVARDGFLYVMEIIHIFIVATLIAKVLFKQFLIRTTV